MWKWFPAGRKQEYEWLLQSQSHYTEIHILESQEFLKQCAGCLLYENSPSMVKINCLYFTLAETGKNVQSKAFMTAKVNKLLGSQLCQKV